MIKQDNSMCTGCGACIEACPKKCISFKKDEYDCVYPYVDINECIECGRCYNVCHLNRDEVFYKKSEDVFAAWNTDVTNRKRAASGGIATALYTYAIDNDIHSYGVVYDVLSKAYYIPIKSKNDILRCQNSKYTYSEMGIVFSDIHVHIKSGEQVLFIGLPCQVAAVRAYVPERLQHLLTTVDIICHGVCPTEYLNKHLQYIEKRYRVKTDAMYFRDPVFGTNQYIFSIYEKSRGVYYKSVKQNDAYQMGYHSSLFYRENCYQCRYARAERVGDLTVSDFSGLGRAGKWSDTNSSVSCIICSTEKGKKLIQELTEIGMIDVQKRPAYEAFDYENMLKRPSRPHSRRKVYLAEYCRHFDFEKAVRRAMWKDLLKNKIIYGLKIDLFTKRIACYISKETKQTIKRIIKYGK